MTAYKVSPSELRQLQKICYEMLIEIDRICRKNDIQYSVDGGTLSGTNITFFIPLYISTNLYYSSFSFRPFFYKSIHLFISGRKSVVSWS